ncbi:TPA: hypothetical protein DCX16_06685 [bacterium]|nr:hypothetical protein [bacterium]
MEKKLILFIVLSFLILYIHSLFYYRREPPEQPVQIEKEDVQKEEKKEQPVEKPPVISIDERDLKVEGELISLNISENGTIKNLFLKKFNDRIGNPYPIMKENDCFSIFLDGNEVFPDKFFCKKEKRKFVYEKGDFTIIKEYLFSTSSYTFKTKLSFINNTNKTITLPNISISLNSNLGMDPELHDPPCLYLSSAKVEKMKNSALIKDKIIDWIAQQDKYFLFVSIPEKRFSAISLQKEGQMKVMAGFPRYSLHPREVLENNINVYVGPRDYKLLKEQGIDELSGMWFLARYLLYVLVFLEKIVGNYGVAIILLTILIKIILHPLTRKNFKMMKKMAALKPHMDRLREKHKSDHKTLQEEMMKLYKEKGVNPFGGCLPILLQMPIFFALYSALSKAIELRGAAFILWIKDLSLKDPFFILPILMGVTMFIQQKMTPVQDPTSERIMLIMPIVFTLLFFTFPSGLVLYWLVQNILTIIEHWLIYRERD